jgi:hypothetical protein
MKPTYSGANAMARGNGQNLQWTKPEVHEALATLYLRLNGYFTTGLVLHSEVRGQNRGEVDCLAVRFPAHSQRERGVASAPFLAIRPDEVDLVICEVKSSVDGLRFNDSLLKDPPEALRSLLRWSGVFHPSKVNDIADRLCPLLSFASPDAARGVVEAGCRVRPLLCCPSCDASKCGDRWCLLGGELFRYVGECLNPMEPRPECATRYNFELWGKILSPLVTYFKDLSRGTLGTLEGLYQHLGGV